MHQRLHNLLEGARGKTSCPVCNASRYKKAGKKCPSKVVWYLPITPRLQRYFVDPKEAKLMRWHVERKKPNDGDDPKLRHVQDGSQWRALNSFYQYFECDERNFVLGACTDGMNPLATRTPTIAHGLCLYGCTTSPLVVHEVEVHTHEHADSRAKTTGK